MSVEIAPAEVGFRLSGLLPDLPLPLVLSLLSHSEATGVLNLAGPRSECDLAVVRGCVVGIGDRGRTAGTAPTGKEGVFATMKRVPELFASNQGAFRFTPGADPEPRLLKPGQLPLLLIVHYGLARSGSSAVRNAILTSFLAGSPTLRLAKGSSIRGLGSKVEKRAAAFRTPFVMDSAAAPESDRILVASLLGADRLDLSPPNLASERWQALKDQVLVPPRPPEPPLSLCGPLEPAESDQGRPTPASLEAFLPTEEGAELADLLVATAEDPTTESPSVAGAPAFDGASLPPSELDVEVAIEPISSQIGAGEGVRSGETMELGAAPADGGQSPGSMVSNPALCSDEVGSRGGLDRGQAPEQASDEYVAGQTMAFDSPFGGDDLLRGSNHPEVGSALDEDDADADRTIADLVVPGSVALGSVPVPLLDLAPPLGDTAPHEVPKRRTDDEGGAAVVRTEGDPGPASPLLESLPAPTPGMAELGAAARKEAGAEPLPSAGSLEVIALAADLPAPTVGSGSEEPFVPDSAIDLWGTAGQPDPGAVSARVDPLLDSDSDIIVAGSTSDVDLMGLRQSAPGVGEEARLPLETDDLPAEPAAAADHTESRIAEYSFTAASSDDLSSPVGHGAEDEFASSLSRPSSIGPPGFVLDARSATTRQLAIFVIGPSLLFALLLSGLPGALAQLPKKWIAVVVWKEAAQGHLKSVQYYDTDKERVINRTLNAAKNERGRWLWVGVLRPKDGEDGKARKLYAVSNPSRSQVRRFRAIQVGDVFVKQPWSFSPKLMIAEYDVGDFFESGHPIKGYVGFDIVIYHRRGYHIGPSVRRGRARRGRGPGRGK